MNLLNYYFNPQIFISPPEDTGLSKQKCYIMPNFSFIFCTLPMTQELLQMDTGEVTAWIKLLSKKKNMSLLLAAL